MSTILSSVKRAAKAVGTPVADSCQRLVRSLTQQKKASPIGQDLPTDLQKVWDWVTLLAILLACARSDGEKAQSYDFEDGHEHAGKLLAHFAFDRRDTLQLVFLERAVSGVISHRWGTLSEVMCARIRTIKPNMLDSSATALPPALAKYLTSTLVSVTAGNGRPIKYKNMYVAISPLVRHGPSARKSWTVPKIKDNIDFDLLLGVTSPRHEDKPLEDESRKHEPHEDESPRDEPHQKESTAKADHDEPNANPGQNKSSAEPIHDEPSAECPAQPSTTSAAISAFLATLQHLVVRPDTGHDSLYGSVPGSVAILPGSSTIGLYAPPSGVPSASASSDTLAPSTPSPSSTPEVQATPPPQSATLVEGAVVGAVGANAPTKRKRSTSLPSPAASGTDGGLRVQGARGLAKMWEKVMGRGKRLKVDHEEESEPRQPM